MHGYRLTFPFLSCILNGRKSVRKTECDSNNVMQKGLQAIGYRKYQVECRFFCMFILYGMTWLQKDPITIYKVSFWRERSEKKSNKKSCNCSTLPSLGNFIAPSIPCFRSRKYFFTDAYSCSALWVSLRMAIWSALRTSGTLAVLTFYRDAADFPHSTSNDVGVMRIWSFDRTFLPESKMEYLFFSDQCNAGRAYRFRDCQCGFYGNCWESVWFFCIPDSILCDSSPWNYHSACGSTINCYLSGKGKINGVTKTKCLSGCITERWKVDEYRYTGYEAIFR